MSDNTVSDTVSDTLSNEKETGTTLPCPESAPEPTPPPSSKKSLRSTSSVSFAEDLGSVELYHVPLNPLLHVLLDEGVTEYAINDLIRVVTTKICNRQPGVVKYNSATHGKLLQVVLDAYSTSLITEDIHDLIVENWPYTLAYLVSGEPSRWECNHLQELVALPPLAPATESVSSYRDPLFGGNEEDY